MIDARRPRGFSLVELLVVSAILAVLASILLPSLRGTRAQAQAVRCAANLRQLGQGWWLYASEHNGYAMPLSDSDVAASPHASSAPTYWWGRLNGPDVEHERGFLWPYLRSVLRDAGLFECPRQPWGSYVPQGGAGAITSTYGYNGYFLTPARTPGWNYSIGGRPWQNVDRLRDPARLLIFGDTLSELHGGSNNALLDPPLIFQNRRWRSNQSPTGCFRHDGRANFAFADGHGAPLPPAAEGLTHAPLRIGVVSSENDPFYVPDWRDW